MKKLLSLVLIIAILGASMFVLSGCGKDANNGNEPAEANTTEISYVSGKVKYTVSVPKKEDGNPKYEFTDEKPDVENARGSFYIETDGAVIGFSSSGLVYTTSIYYEEKYGENQKGTFDGFIDWVNDPASKIASKDYTQLEINGRKALRRDIKEGSSGDYKYYGYTYMIAADDVMPGSYIDLDVIFKSEEELTSQKDIDSETQSIIDSLTVTVNE